MKAFWAALLAFALTVCLGHVLGEAGVRQDAEGFALWASEDKSRSEVGLWENMTEQTLPVFGSSEFMHGKGEIYHPTEVFRGTDLTPMLIGAGYYQSLSHAVTLAAIEGAMPLRKAVLILSPQWFRKTGVVDQAYTSRFSEALFVSMLENPSLSEETKNYIYERTQLLLGPDPGTLERVERDWAYEKGEKAGAWENLMEKVWLGFLQEKDRFSISLKQVLAGTALGGKTSSGERKKLTKEDWESLLAQGVERGEKEDQNPFYISQECYDTLLPYLPLKKGMNADAQKGYQTGPEFDDLRCFLRVARETGIEVMLVLVPVNGYYYDYTEFPASARAAYYEKIRTLAQEEGGKVADFSGEEYTKYFFEDRVHLGKTGWVKVGEAIYDFGTEKQE